jgi:hypothetical protein
VTRTTKGTRRPRISPRTRFLAGQLAASKLEALRATVALREALVPGDATPAELDRLTAAMLAAAAELRIAVKAITVSGRR